MIRLDARRPTVLDKLFVDCLLFFEPKQLAYFSKLLESLHGVKLDVALKLFVANRAEKFYTATTLLISAHGTIHYAFIVDAAAHSKLVTDLTAHDVNSCHHELFRVILKSIPNWVVAAERDAANSRIKACPTIAELPGWLRVQILHCHQESSISICWLKSWHFAQ